MRISTLCVFVLGLVVAGCATVAPFDPTDRIELQADEKRLWNRAREEQEKLDRSGQLYSNPPVTAYVNEIAARVFPRTAGNPVISFEVKIIKNPLLNAFAFPHGAIYIHTGMLARMENEAQLATILAHEMAHVLRRHMIRHFRTVQNSAATLATLQIAFLPLGPYGLIGSLLGSLGATAAVSGYSQSSENEADRDGLSMMVSAGYDPRESPKLFDYLKIDIETGNAQEPFFFGSHPRLEERKEHYSGLLQRQYAGTEGEKGTEEFMSKMLPILLDNAAFDLALGRFQIALEALERVLEREPGNSRARFQVAEVCRLRNEKDDPIKAEQFYLEAIHHDPSYPPPHRGLGLLWLKLGEREKARTAFERYLALAPGAEDRKYIEQYLHEIQNSRSAS